MKFYLKFKGCEWYVRFYYNEHFTYEKRPCVLSLNLALKYQELLNSPSEIIDALTGLPVRGDDALFDVRLREFYEKVG